MKVVKIILCFLVFSAGGCSESTSPEKDNCIYFNSFETVEDFEGWQGISEKSWRLDAPVNGGNRSVFILGGCIVPHGLYSFPNTIKSGYYTIECWGKADIKNSGGGACLFHGNYDLYKNTITFVSFTDTVWRYKYSEPMFLPDSAILQIEFSGSYFLLDNICVRKIN